MVILFDEFHLPKSIYDVIFATDQQALVAKFLIVEMKKQGGSLGKTEMSMFANQLHEGTTIEVEKSEGEFKRREKMQISYNKRQFYDRILTPMRSMGMIDYDMYKKHYTISDKFNKLLIKFGLKWLQEVNKT